VGKLAVLESILKALIAIILSVYIIYLIQMVMKFKIYAKAREAGERGSRGTCPPTLSEGGNAPHLWSEAVGGVARGQKVGVCRQPTGLC